MPVQFDFEAGVIALRVVDASETADIRAALRDALADARSHDAVGLLFDVRRSASLRSRPAEEVRRMGRYFASHRGRYGARLALVASEDFAYGLMRVCAMAAEGGGVAAAVLRDEAAARAWLGR